MIPFPEALSQAALSFGLANMVHAEAVGLAIAVLGILGSLASVVIQLTTKPPEQKIEQADSTPQIQSEEFNKQAALDEGQYETGRLRRLARRELGRQRAVIGKAGVTFEGTALDTSVFMAEEFEADALNAQREGINRAILADMSVSGLKQADDYSNAFRLDQSKRQQKLLAKSATTNAISTIGGSVTGAGNSLITYGSVT